MQNDETPNQPLQPVTINQSPKKKLPTLIRRVVPSNMRSKRILVPFAVLVLFCVGYGIYLGVWKGFSTDSDDPTNAVVRGGSISGSNVNTQTGQPSNSSGSLSDNYVSGSTNTTTAAKSCLKPEYQGVLDSNWPTMKQRLTSTMQVRLDRGDTYVLYDMQTYTNNLLNMAIICQQPKYIDELASLYLIARPYMKSRNGHLEWHCSTDKCVNWKTHPYIENEIVSSQFVYLLSRTINAISHVPPHQRTSAMNTFVKTYVHIVHQHHLSRWIYATRSTDKVFGTFAACGDTAKRNHYDHLKMLQGYSYPKLKSYCNIVLDKDLWIIGAATELGDAAATDPALVPIPASDIEKYRQYSRLGVSVLTLTHGHFKLITSAYKTFDDKPANAVILDPGGWRDHPDYAYASYTGKNIPSESQKALGPASIGWDISHGRRIVHVIGTLYEKKEFTQAAFPTDSFMRALAGQVAYGMFNRSYSTPLFSNYMDGTNGWYRVGYNGASGTVPYGLSKSVATGGYGFWAQHNNDLKKIMVANWNKLNKISKDDPMNQKYYVFDSSPYSFDMLMLTPTMVYVE